MINSITTDVQDKAAILQSIIVGFIMIDYTISEFRTRGRGYSRGWGLELSYLMFMALCLFAFHFLRYFIDYTSLIYTLFFTIYFSYGNYIFFWKRKNDIYVFYYFSISCGCFLIIFNMNIYFIIGILTLFHVINIIGKRY